MQTCPMLSLGFLAWTLSSVALSGQVTILVSEIAPGVPIQTSCSVADVSDDGRFVSFQSTSDAIDPVPNGMSDVFVRDLATGLFERVSEPTGGGTADGGSFGARITPDGRWVVFESDASNLVPGDTNGSRDCFLHDRQTGETTRVSTGSGGSQSSGLAFGPVVSDDGRIVAFYSAASDLVPGDSNGTFDVFVKDTLTGVTSLVSKSSLGLQADAGCTSPSLSGDGRLVTFQSKAVTLSLSDTNGDFDVFLRDRHLATTTRLSSAPDGTVGDGASTGAVLSADGGTVAFVSAASNLVAVDPTGAPDVYVRDLASGVTTRIPGSGAATTQGLSGDGRLVLLTTSVALTGSDTNGKPDVYVYDRDASAAIRASVSTAGVQSSLASVTPAMGSDGRYVVFQSQGTELAPNAGPGNEVDVFRRDTRRPFTDLGLGLAGVLGVPVLEGQGTVEPGTLVTLELTGAQPSALVSLVLGLLNLSAPFKGGTMVPKPELLLPLNTDVTGGFVLPALWPLQAPPGVPLYLQAWVQDATGPVGFAASNGLSMETP